MFRIAVTLLAALILMGLAGIACGDSDDADEHDADASADEHDADADADEHDADLDDPDPSAYLEVEPKEALFLMDMASFSFAPDALQVAAGEVVEIAIQNSEMVLHDFTIDEIDADVHVSYLGGTGQHAHEEPANEADVHFALTEPASGVVHLKINEPGEYVFYCSVPGHQEQGMEGRLIVTEG
jgi:uncharacterized cupredoxin-like copper-binding protein